MSRTSHPGKAAPALAGPGRRYRDSVYGGSTNVSYFTISSIVPVETEW